MRRKLVLIRVGWFCVILFCASSGQATNVEFRGDALIRPGDDFEIVGVYDTPPDVTTVHMFGGSVITLQTYDSSIANVHNGRIVGSIEVRELSTINIYGGDVDLSFLAVSDSATLNIFGGKLLSGRPYFSEYSAVNIYGYGFSYDGFALTGFLSDGSNLMFIELPFDDYSHMNLVEIPEPGLLLLLGLGAMGLRKGNT